MSQLRISGSAKSRFSKPNVLSAGFLIVLGAGLSVSACGGGDGEDNGSGGSGGTSPGSGGDGGQGGEANGSGGTEPGWEGVSCDERSDAGALKLSGTITKDGSWSGVVYLEDDVIIEGAEVTIEAGTQIVAAKDASLTVTDGGIVVASGKEDEPVRFCGEEEGAGVWQGLSFEESASGGSKLSYVLVSDAGSKDQAVLLDAAVLVKELKVERSNSDGVHASIFTKGSAGLSVRRSKGLPVVLTSAAAVSPFPLGGEFEANEEETIHLRFDTIEVEATFNDPGVPYVQELGITTKSGNVAYEAGVHYLFAEGTFITHGEEAPVRKVDINGTEESPVVFEGVEHRPGFYEDLTYADFVDPGSVMTHFEVRHAHSPSQSQTAITISDAFFQNNSYAMIILGQGLNGASKNVTIDSEYDYSIRIAPPAVYSLPLGGSFIRPVIFAGAETIQQSGTLPNPGVPYSGDLLLGSGATLTVPPGIVFDLNGPDGSLASGVIVRTGAKLVVEGTKEAPVKFELGVNSLGLIFAADGGEGSILKNVEIGEGSSCVNLSVPVTITDSKVSNCSTQAILATTSLSLSRDEASYSSRIADVVYSNNSKDLVFVSED